ncbi:unnamed protein product [Rangifer tarandus platyrhynchus]|uniref:Uncharacterized protein n=1 Tax=Rangifer tarandus platyrhynchus TaxID=3082113 RepID=A0ACB1MK32_RANTA
MDCGCEVKMLMSLAPLELRIAEATAKPSRLVGIGHTPPPPRVQDRQSPPSPESAEARGCQRCAGFFPHTTCRVSVCRLVGRRVGGGGRSPVCVSHWRVSRHVALRCFV